MGVPQNLIDPLRDIVHELVIGNYQRLEEDGRAGRLTSDQIRWVVERYGRKLIELPPEAFEIADSYKIEGQTDSWAIDLPLWTKEEGRSDLTLTLTASITPAGVRLEIDDLHVP